VSSELGHGRKKPRRLFEARGDIVISNEIDVAENKSGN
jgi:hypothetical protein